jgi:hypothetical protein
VAHFPDLKLGTYHHNIVSAHYFNNEQPLVDAILSCTETGMSQKKRVQPPMAG